jgi:hypothetical protein
MNIELEKSSHGLIKVLFWNILEGLRKIIKKKSVFTVGVLAKIQTEHLQNTSLECYLGNNLFSDCSAMAYLYLDQLING